MNIEALIHQLVEHEGEKLHAYKDSLGYLTIGVGRLIDPKRGGGITQEESRYLLANDIVKKITQLNLRLPWWRDLSDIRQQVLVDMTFNLGIDGLLKFKNTLRAIREGRFSDAANGMRDSLWYVQVKARRGERLALMMEHDCEVPLEEARKLRKVVWATKKFQARVRPRARGKVRRRTSRRKAS